ncbi:glycosyltransferase family 39 protein [Acidobacteriota bacterium]
MDKIMFRKLSIPWPVLVAALFVFVCCNLISYFIFDHVPHIHDEGDYLFQAKIFKLGKLYVPSPPVKESFDFPHMINNGKLYSQYTPGFPFLLLIGLLFNAPWLVNPLLGALAIFCFYFLGKEVFNQRVGILASFLGAVSLWFLLMSSSMMSHTSCLFFLSFFLLFFFRSLKNPTVKNGLFAGMGIGMAFLIRPYSTALIGFPFILYFLFRFIQNYSPRLKNVMAFVSVMIITASILMIYNYLTNGNPLRMGFVVCHGKEFLPGFGTSGCYDFPHTPLKGAENTLKYLRSLNTYLFGWPFSLLPALFAVVNLRKSSLKVKKKELLLISGFLCLMIGYFFYWGTTETIGPRFYFEGVPLLILLSARGIEGFICTLGLKLKKISPDRIRKAVYILLAILTLYSFVYRFPKWIWPTDTEWNYDTYAENFAGANPKIHQTFKSIPLSNALVIFNLIQNHAYSFPEGAWVSGFIYNDPELKEDIVYARYLKEKNIDLIRSFANRKSYLYAGILDKGFLIPIEEKENAISYGKPIVITVEGNKNGFALLSNPRGLYTIYSPEFGDFIDRLYTRNEWFSVETNFLIEKGNSYKNSMNFQEAAFYYEAALQLEKIPLYRYDALNQLATCYSKLGKKAEAEKIFQALSNPYRTRLFDLFPEKGF